MGGRSSDDYFIEAHCEFMLFAVGLRSRCIADVCRCNAMDFHCMLLWGPCELDDIINTWASDRVLVLQGRFWHEYEEEEPKLLTRTIACTGHSQPARTDM